MEMLRISESKAGIHIEGFPDAVGLVPLSSPKAKRLAHLGLHKADLDFALACLKQISHVDGEPSTIEDSLWRSAIVHYVKCFGQSKSRFQLSAKSVYKHEPEGALVAFEYFRSLRDKHIVHDENSYAQSSPTAVINGGGKSYKVEKIVCITLVSKTISQTNYENLVRLVTLALSWVVAEFDVICGAITKELEALPHDVLLSRIDNVSHKFPSAEDVHGRRTP